MFFILGVAFLTLGQENLKRGLREKDVLSILSGIFLSACCGAAIVKSNERKE